MTQMRPDCRRGCPDMRLLLQADLDGELDAAATAALAAHVEQCPGCLQEQRDLLRLAGALRDAAPRPRAPDALRRSIEATLALPRDLPPAPSGFRRLAPLLSFGAGAAMAGGIALLLLPPVRGEQIDGQLLASHLRALQPGHLTDVLSTDQHTVKPWFDGRIDYAPPVRDFSAQGFPLIGGRLDYVAGRAVAVLVYGHGRHVIDVYVWPSRGAAAPAPEARQGFNFAAWTDRGMRLSAVSDVDPAALAALVRLWSVPPGRGDGRS